MCQINGSKVPKIVTNGLAIDFDFISGQIAIMIKSFNKSKNHSRYIPWLLTLFGLSLNLKTLCPYIYWKDAGEVTSALATMGICHPSGYAAYTLLGFLFSRIPIGDIALRANLLSAIAGMLLPPVAFLWLRRMKISSHAAIWGSILCCLAHEIWLQASVNEIYSFSLILMVSAAYFCSGKTIKDMYFAAFTMGFGLAHHLTMILLIPAYLALFCRSQKRPSLRSVIVALSISMLAFSSILYLPIRSHQNPVADFGNPEKFALLKDHFLTKHYQAKMWPSEIEPIKYRVIIISKLILKQYGYILCILSLYGFIIAIKRTKWQLFVVLFSSAHAAFLLYPPDHSFLIPLIFLIGCMMALGLDQLYKILKKRQLLSSSSLLLIRVCLPVIFVMSLFVSNYCYSDKSNHFYARDYSRSILNPIPWQSTVMTSGDNLYSLIRYSILCEHFRDDITHFHRPILTWPDGLESTRVKHPEWFQDSLENSSDTSPVPSAIHSEASTEEDYLMYRDLIEKITINAARNNDVFWELGSDIRFLFRNLDPAQILLVYNRKESDQLFLKRATEQQKFWTDFLLPTCQSVQFRLDHNAVSEYAVNSYNYSNYYQLKNVQNLTEKMQFIADKMWKSQLDPEPHNTLVEKMEEIISPSL